MGPQDLKNTSMWHQRTNEDMLQGSIKRTPVLAPYINYSNLHQCTIAFESSVRQVCAACSNKATWLPAHQIYQPKPVWLASFGCCMIGSTASASLCPSPQAVEEEQFEQCRNICFVHDGTPMLLCVVQTIAPVGGSWGPSCSISSPAAAAAPSQCQHTTVAAADMPLHQRACSNQRDGCPGTGGGSGALPVSQ